MRRRSAAALIVLVAMGCGSRPTTPSPVAGPISALASNYLNEVIAIMQANSINRLSIDWTDFQSKVFASVPHAQSIADTYPAIQLALRLLGDMHSSYTTAAGQLFTSPQSAPCQAPFPLTSTAPPDVGYVKVNSCCADPVPFLDDLQQQIRTQDSPNLVGWVVDLRGNGGGNMWPMLAGIGPVLGEGVAGYFVHPGGMSDDFEYVAGAAELAGLLIAKASNPYKLLRGNPKTAVLTDKITASSGEAIAVAFKNRPGTRSFGTLTCGLSTANASHTLSDGAVLNLTDAVLADRTKVTYGGPILPDETIVDPAAVMPRAIDWLHGL